MFCMVCRFFLFLSLLFFSACASPDLSGPAASKIVVLKSRREMFLFDSYGQPLRSYKIAMGGNPVGPKQCEGDERTPEGLYMIETRNPDSKYHLSLKISYPNAQDVEQAESMGLSPGGDIFIHGVPNQSSLLDEFMYQFQPGWTDGCIAVRNRDMEELWTLVADGTPIEIRP